MIRRVSIDELLRAGTTFDAGEVLAIARELIHPTDPPAYEPRTPFGPPSAENVLVEPDGTVWCSCCQTPPTVSELAIFLQGLLPREAPGVAGSIRYALARALHEVDAPPFDSLDDFVQALSRHDQGDSRAVVRAMLDRVARTEAGAMLNVERRRQAPSVADLRRHLRDADVRVYEQQMALDALAEETSGRHRRKPSLLLTVAAAGTLVLFGAGEAARLRQSPEAAAPSRIASPALPSPAPIAPAAPVDIAKAAPDGDADLARAHTTLTSAPAASSPSRMTIHRSSRDRTRTAGARKSKLLDRLHLNWLRSKLAIRAKAL